MEKIQIVTPVYNEEKNIYSTLENFFEEYKDNNFKISFIISEDGSTDNSIKIINDLKKVYDIKHKSYINIETHTAVTNFDSILEIISPHLDGIVFGRVDYVSSLGMNRDTVNTDEVLSTVKNIHNKCK